MTELLWLLAKQQNNNAPALFTPSARLPAIINQRGTQLKTTLDDDDSGGI